MQQIRIMQADFLIIDSSLLSKYKLPMMLDLKPFIEIIAAHDTMF